MVSHKTIVCETMKATPVISSHWFHIQYNGQLMNIGRTFWEFLLIMKRLRNYLYETYDCERGEETTLFINNLLNAGSQKNSSKN